MMDRILIRIPAKVEWTENQPPFTSPQASLSVTVGKSDTPVRL